LSALIPDDFLTDIVGRPTFRVEVGQDGPTAETIAAIGDAQRRPVFLYTRVPTGSVRAVRSFEDLGFGVVDTSVIFEHPALEGRTTSVATRPARPEDRGAVMALAARSFCYSRLHLDPAIPRDIADRSRAEWAGNFFTGRRGDHMIVAEASGGLAGFAQLLGPRDHIVTIDLIGVAAPLRRRGIAAALIAAAGKIAGAQTLRVGTQIANTASLLLYETLGFRVVETYYVLHCHRV
jgi:ribosomal protein S18 acetylase RimI-like enzyme